MKKSYSLVIGSITGFINGIFGSGGGILAVPMLHKAGFEERKCHASSIAITLPLSLVSAFFYGAKGSIDWRTALPLIIPGLIGALIGVFLLKKIPNTLLKRIFGIILIISSIRMLML